jgi:hypothetical protein
MIVTPALHRTQRQVYSQYRSRLSFSSSFCYNFSIKEYCRLVHRGFAIPRITFTLTPSKQLGNFSCFSTVFYLLTPSNTRRISEKVVKRGGFGGGLSRNMYYGLLRNFSSLTRALCPFSAAHDSGVRSLSSWESESTPSLASSSLNTALCPLSAAHDSSVQP